MNKNLFFVLATCALLSGLSLLAFPLLSSAQQRPQKVGQVQNQKPDVAIQAVRRSAISSRFYDKLQLKEPEWQLNRAYYNLKGEVGNDANSAVLFIKDGKNAETTVKIFEYESEKEAESLFASPRQQASLEDCGKDAFGDRCVKVYRHNGNFAELSFRSGNFFVMIASDSEEAAKRFAKYVLESISNK